MNNEIYDLVSKRSDWISVSINLDEDLHFSTQYLRSSIKGNQNAIFSGYSELVSTYHHFNEEYFLRESECISASKELILRMQKNPDWFNGVIDNILQLSNKLGDLFDYHYFTKSRFQDMSNSELLGLYNKQRQATFELYQFARIPETLDRGVCFFTNFLYGILKKKLKKETVDNEFFILTAPETATIFQVAENELREIGNLIRIQDSNYSYRNIILYSHRDLKEKIENFLNKWRYLYYHGYGNRRVLDYQDILERLNGLSSNIIDCNTVNQRKMEIKDNIGLSEDEFYMFLQFPKIALTKLYRKYFQIKNFYFLDLILEEVSYRSQRPEAAIRSMLPEEIIGLLEGGRINEESILKRINSCVYYISFDKEVIESDDENILDIERHLRNCISKSGDYSAVFRGYPASQGVALAECRVINRRSDALNFHRGDIIISDSADPDIFDFILSAGALLTRQGGVTSHASIFCREHGIPAIVGIKNIFDIQNGTVVHVDANVGIVSLAAKNIIEDNYSKEIGSKASTLLFLQDHGFDIPLFNVVEYSKVVTNQSNSKYLQSIILRVSQHGKYPIIIRSSALDEDNQECSNVGKYCSVPNTSYNCIIEGVRTFITNNSKLHFRGGVIFQQMLPFDFCGVAISGDHRINRKNEIVIEVCAGATNYITSGTIVPCRLIVDRDTFSIEKIINPDAIYIRDLNINKLLYTILNVEKKLGYNVDIEWAVYEGKIFILQARPISGI